MAEEYSELDGSWAPSSVGYDWLVPAVFLAHGETPASEEYGDGAERNAVSINRRYFTRYRQRNEKLNLTNGIVA